MKKHEPERAAVAYLTGAIRKRKRAAFERHMMECEECWREVRLGCEGRSLAESARELAPQRLREQVRALVSASDLPKRRLILQIPVPPMVAFMVLVLGLAYLMGRPPDQPEVIDAALTGFRAAPPPTSVIENKLPERLGDLSHQTSYRETLAGLDVTVHVYRDPAGHKVLVYQADRTFPLAAGAQHSDDGRTWTAQVEGLVLFCADDPIPSLVVGDDEREVQLAIRTLGLR